MMEVLLPAKLGGHNTLFGGCEYARIVCTTMDISQDPFPFLSWLFDPWRFGSRWKAMYGACFFKDVLIVNENKCEPRTFKKLACFCCCSHKGHENHEYLLLHVAAGRRPCA